MGTKRYMVTARTAGAERYEIHDTLPENGDVPEGFALFVASTRTPKVAARLAELMNAHGMDGAQ